LEPERGNYDKKRSRNGRKKLNEREPQWFCPLINGQCKKDCINFMLAFVESTNKESNGMLHDAKDDSFAVEGFICSNAMFIGN